MSVPSASPAAANAIFEGDTMQLTFARARAATFGLAAGLCLVPAAGGHAAVIFDTLGPTNVNTGGYGVRHFPNQQNEFAGQVFTSPGDGFLNLVELQVGGVAPTAMTLSFRPSPGSAVTLGALSFTAPAWPLQQCGACYPVTTLNVGSLGLVLHTGVSYTMYVSLSNPFATSANNSGWAQFAANNPSVTTLVGLGDPNAPTNLFSSSPDAASRVHYAPNLAPTANAGPNLTIDYGDPLLLNGSSFSTDANFPHGDALTYAWDIDNDGQFDDATGATPSIAFASYGGIFDPGTTHTVRLRVTDRFGLTSTDTVDVTVTPEPAVLALLGVGLLALVARRRATPHVRSRRRGLATGFRMATGLASLCIALAMTSHPLTAAAAPVSFELRGHITLNNPTAGVSVGDQFAVVIQYDSATSDSFADPTEGVYFGTGSFSLSLGALSTVGSLSSIHVMNDHVTGPIAVDLLQWHGGGFSTGALTVGLGLQSDVPNSPGYLSSDALPTSVELPAGLVPGDIPFARFQLVRTFGTTNEFVVGVVDSVSAVAEPSPALLVLLASGLAALGLRRRSGTWHS